MKKQHLLVAPTTQKKANACSATDFRIRINRPSHHALPLRHCELRLRAWPGNRAAHRRCNHQPATNRESASGSSDVTVGERRRKSPAFPRSGLGVRLFSANRVGDAIPPAPATSARRDQVLDDHLLRKSPPQSCRGYRESVRDQRPTARPNQPAPPWAEANARSVHIADKPC